MSFNLSCWFPHRGFPKTSSNRKTRLKQPVPFEQKGVREKSQETGDSTHSSKTSSDSSQHFPIIRSADCHTWLTASNHLWLPHRFQHVGRKSNWILWKFENLEGVRTGLKKMAYDFVYQCFIIGFTTWFAIVACCIFFYHSLPQNHKLKGLSENRLSQMVNHHCPRKWYNLVVLLGFQMLVVAYAILSPWPIRLPRGSTNENPQGGAFSSDACWLDSLIYHDISTINIHKP